MNNRRLLLYLCYVYLNLKDLWCRGQRTTHVHKTIQRALVSCATLAFGSRANSYMSKTIAWLSILEKLAPNLWSRTATCFFFTQFHQHLLQTATKFKDVKILVNWTYSSLYQSILISKASFGVLKYRCETEKIHLSNQHCTWKSTFIVLWQRW